MSCRSVSRVAQHRRVVNRSLAPAHSAGHSQAHPSRGARAHPRAAPCSAEVAKLMCAYAKEPFKLAVLK